MAETVQLKTFRVAGAKSAGKLPTRIKLLGWGVNATSEGPIIVDEHTVRVFSANQKRIGRERVALDFEHNTVPGSAEYERTREPRDISGNLSLIVVPGEGLFGEALTYTSTGEAKSENFEDLSLAPYVDAENRVIGAHSVALTRTGAAYGITFCEAARLSAGDVSDHLKILATNQQNTMPEKFITLSALAGILGLDANADEPAVLAKLKTSLTPPAIPDLTPLTARIVTLEGKAPASTDLTPLTTRLAALEKKLTDGETATTDAERGRLIALFATDGKVPRKADGTVYSKDEMKALDVGTLKLLHANTPVTVPLRARSNVSQTDGGQQFVEKDTAGKIIRVDLGAMFDAEAAARGTAAPNI